MKRLVCRHLIRMLGVSYKVQIVRFFFTGWSS